MEIYKTLRSPFDPIREFQNKWDLRNKKIYFDLLEKVDLSCIYIWRRKQTFLRPCFRIRSTVKEKSYSWNLTCNLLTYIFLFINYLNLQSSFWEKAVQNKNDWNNHQEVYVIALNHTWQQLMHVEISGAVLLQNTSKVAASKRAHKQKQ